MDVTGELSRAEVLLLTKEQKAVRARHKAKARQKKHYYSDLGKSRREAREKSKEYRMDPRLSAKIKARKRASGAGLTPGQIRKIEEEQRCRCAICGDPNPTDLDHCHRTGAVRWLLCRHCNRGLGAFRDQPDLLRRAADMLEKKARPSK